MDLRAVAVLATLVAVVSFGSSALADDGWNESGLEHDTPADDLPNLRPVVVRVWLQPPFANATLSRVVGPRDLDYGSGSAGMELQRRFPIEIGGGDLVGSNMSDPRTLDLWIRGGVVSLGSGRERGWAQQFVLMGGYRYMERRGAITIFDANAFEDVTGTETVHALTFDVGSQWTMWLSTNFGVGVRILGGLVIPVYKAHSGAWGDPRVDVVFHEMEMHVAGHLGFEAGVAF